jgi:hypothetical protein
MPREGTEAVDAVAEAVGDTLADAVGVGFAAFCATLPHPIVRRARAIAAGRANLTRA